MGEDHDFVFYPPYPCFDVCVPFLFFCTLSTLLIMEKGLKPSLRTLWLMLCAVGLEAFSRAVNEIDSFPDDFFLALMFIYLLDVSVRFFGLGWRSFRANGWNLFDLVVASGSFITTLAVRFGNSGFATQQLQKLFLVSIAFKLVQRTNSLNMLFKTAVYVFLLYFLNSRKILNSVALITLFFSASLPVILSLLGLWLVLFLFFAILYVEVFGLTKWGGVETRTTNYYSLGHALVMLAFQSTGFVTRFCSFFQRFHL